jgi:heterodisulfide reductase subunit C
MIEFNGTQKDLFHDICESADVRTCFSCGTCIAGCPASHAEPPLLIRTLVRQVVWGLEDELLDDDTPWSCVTCSKCEEMCPMGVNPFEVCLAIRRWQCRNDETRIPMAVVEIYHRGYTQPIEKVQKLRSGVGLVETLPTLTEFPDLLKKFQALLMDIELIQSNAFMFKE